MKYLFFLFSVFLFSQENSLQVRYNRTLTSEFTGDKFNRNSYLITAEYASLYYIDFTSSKSNGLLTEVANDNSSKRFVINQKSNTYTYKDFKSQELITQNKLLNKRMYVTETLDNMKWKLGKHTKSILGYMCQQASTAFRGRTYTAWFSPEIPIHDGPWKFQNLPGLILEVYSDDELLHLTAKEIKYISKEDAENLIYNPYKDKEVITREKFETIFKEKQQNLENYSPHSGRSYQMRGGIEIID